MRRCILIALVVAVALAPALPAGAAGEGTSIGGEVTDRFAPSADTTVSGPGRFRFFGSGYGHGIGMSQWGAYGLARKGWSHRRILTHFYRGTKVQRPASPVGRIRVGLTYDRKVIHLAARGGPVRLWLNEPKGKPVAKVPGGKTWTVRSADSGFKIRDHRGNVVGRRTWGGPSFPLFATYRGSGSRAFVPEADAVWHQGFSYNRGYLEFDQYRCRGSCLQRLTLPISFEEYLYGLGEMPSSWPAHALQAQAVAARTYATYTVRHYGLRSSCDCHLSDGADDQVYIGYDKEGGPMGRRWVRAVRATTGRIVTYRGAVIQSFYAASDGGHSENVEDVWHDGNPAYAIPYLRGVCDPGEYTAANPWTNWSRSFTAGELSRLLSPYTGGVGTVTSFPSVRRGVSGRVVSALVKGTGGRARVSGIELRAALSLPDDRVWINRNKNIVGVIRAKYDDLMCKPGLPTSPVGALSGGARQKFRTGGIYRNSRADVTVWLKGGIYREYIQVGGAGGTLGLPTSRVHPLVAERGGCSQCSRVVFQRGRIYYKSGPGAHALWGKVLRVYLDRGGASGSLGFPTSHVRKRHGVRSATFEHGAISCPSSGPCQVS